MAINSLSFIRGEKLIGIRSLSGAIGIAARVRVLVPMALRAKPWMAGGIGGSLIRGSPSAHHADWGSWQASVSRHLTALPDF
jgi:hypothetical protein